jgi:putative ABC transport system ATP-binding protein
MTEQILNLTGIHKSFNLGSQETQIIKGAGFSVNKGDFMILFGPSGCGKSTMLNILLGLEPPNQGEVFFLGKNLYSFSEDERAQMRKQQVGIIYQQSNWVKSLSVLENVYFPLTLRGLPEEERKERALAALKMVGMEHGATQNPAELSGGQQQRVSLARALISDPALIVADEPTGNLDSKASEEIMALFKQFNQQGKTVIMVTHDLEYLKFASRSVNMVDGVVVGEYSANDDRLKSMSVSKKGILAKEKKDD